MLNCPLCGAHFTDVRRLLRHVCMLHSHDPQFNLTCGLDGCIRTFSTYGSFKTHVHRDHHSKYSNKHSQHSHSSAKVICSGCAATFNTVRDLVSHFRATHDRFACPAKGCVARFAVFSSFSSHMSRSHRGLLLSDIKEELVQGQVEHTSNHEFEADFPPHGACGVDIDIPEGDGEQMHDITQSLALFILKTQEKHNLPVSVVQEIVDDVGQLMDSAKDSVHACLHTKLGSSTVDPDTLTLIDQCVEEADFMAEAKECLKTEHLRKKYYQEHFGFLPPQTWSLGKNHLNRDCSFQYVSICDNLQAFCSNAGVLAQLMNPKSQKEGILADYRDGSAYHSRLFFTVANTLELLLYFDEFEVVNPLGAHRKKHKIAAFYYVLGNLYPENRSSLSSIQLAILCKCVDLKEFGLAKVLEPLISDLHKLEHDGISLPGLPEKIKGGIAFMSSDNLGSHFIGGYFESFSSTVLRACRFCMATSQQVQSEFDVSKFPARTKEVHAYHLQQIALNPDSTSTYGLKFDSPLNQVAHFHTSEHLPPDIMHDLFEGVVPMEIALVLLRLHDDNHAKLPYVQERLATFKYGYLDAGNKPACLPELATMRRDLNIKQNAGRCWCLIRLLPIVIGHRVPEDYLPWKLLLMVKEITEIVCAPAVPVEQVAYLNMLIQDHHQLFREIFPEVRLKPKHHFLCHYPEQLLKFGPLLHAWCMRYEAKHNYFKLLARTVGNFINIPLTLATRHQLRQCYENARGTRFSDTRIEITDSVPLDVNILRDDYREQCEKNNVDEGYFLVNKVKLHGILYKKGAYVCTSSGETDSVNFGKILMIFVKAQSVSYLVRIYSCEQDFHRGAYRVAAGLGLDIIRHNAIADYYPLSSYTVNGHELLVLKHYICAT